MRRLHHPNGGTANGLFDTTEVPGESLGAQHLTVSHVLPVRQRQPEIVVGFVSRRGGEGRKGPLLRQAGRSARPDTVPSSGLTAPPKNAGGAVAVANADVGGFANPCL